MTVLGKHTMQETRDLMATIEFRIKKNQEVMDKIPASPDKTALDRDWQAFLARWAINRDEVADKLLVLRIGQPVAPASVIVAEKEFEQIRITAEFGPDRVSRTNNFMSIMIRAEQLSGITFSEKEAPAPEGFDPDLAAFKKVDSAIKSGEQAAAEAKAAAAKAAKSNMGMLIVGGIAAGAALFVGGVVISKVYL